MIQRQTDVLTVIVPVPDHSEIQIETRQSFIRKRDVFRTPSSPDSPRTASLNPLLRRETGPTHFLSG